MQLQHQVSIGALDVNLAALNLDFNAIRQLDRGFCYA